MILLSNQSHFSEKSEIAIGIVTPVFNQPKLCFEAIRAVQNQTIAEQIVHVIVSDGGEFKTQSRVLQAASATYENVDVLFGENAGPGAARNLGVEHLLRNYPGLKYVFFLDSDNRLEPWAMEVASERLSQSSADWLYSDIHMIGVNEQHTVRGDYNAFHHRFQNFCDTGSMVKVDLLKQGLRFNPDRRDGYEDWGFWLSAQQMGARGEYCEDFGFRYRRRGASRYVEEVENHDSILKLFRKRYSGAFSFSEMKRLETVEAPRFAIETGSGEWYFSSDPLNRGGSLSFDEVKSKFCTYVENQSLEGFPPYIAFVNEDLWEFPWSKKFLRDIFLRADLHLRKKGVFTARLQSANEGTFGVQATKSEVSSEFAPVVVFIRTSVLVECSQNSAEDWLFSQICGGPDGVHADYKFPVSDDEYESLTGFGLPQYGFSRLAKLLSKKSISARENRWDWKQRDLNRSLNQFCGWTENLDTFCRPQIQSNGDKTIAFVIRICDFGGAEKVIYNVAKEFFREGWKVTLFLFGNNIARSPAEHFECFSDIFIFDDPFTNDDQLHEWGSPQRFRGETFPGAIPNNNLTNALNGFDVVINAHSWAFNAIALELKKLGVVTGSYLHLVDQSPFGRPVGHPHVSLAFEYAYDLFISCSKSLKSWLSGAGVPEENLCFVKNAPGYERFESRGIRTTNVSSPLKVLYAGRLDRQKGIDRLETVHAATQDWVDWRVIGKALFAGGGTSIPDLIDPIYDESLLQEQYEWADVMVLLSDYEGVPLAILEAQRAGCVVIATNVGGVAEAISHGENGYLLPLADASESCVDILSKLSDDRSLLQSISASAQEKAKANTWSKNCDPLLRMVEEKVQRKKRHSKH